MWIRAQEALEEAARIQRHFCTLAQTSRVPSWSPPVDVFEIDDGLLIVAVLPGVDASRIEIQLQEGLLRISAPRELPPELHGARILHMEIPLGYFERSIQLPGGRFYLSDSALADGLLHLRLTHERGGSR